MFMDVVKRALSMGRKMFREIPEREKLLVLSLLVGICSGLAAVILQSFVHMIQHALTSHTDSLLGSLLYLVLPGVGMLISLIFIKYFIIIIIFLIKITHLAEEIFYNPKHEYTKGLLRSIPNAANMKQRLVPISGTPINMLNLPKGCAFCTRCEKAMKVCLTEPPEEMSINENHKASCWLNVLAELEAQLSMRNYKGFLG